MEVWAGIPEFPDYAVSTFGRVKRVVGGKRGQTVGRLIAAHPNNRGYLMVDLMCDGKRRTLLVHRLVAKAFVPGEWPGAEVNHDDGQKRNNIPSNLIWSTRSVNMKHMIDVLKGHANRRVFEATSPDGEVFVSDNLTTFAAEHGLCRPHCVSVATGNRPHHKGWHFRHIQEEQL